MKIISGGQTGADRAGLDAALAVGLETGGWMPKGFLAQDGLHPEFAEKYGIREHTSSQYPPRTACNVKDADATIRIATDWGSPGEKLTLKFIRQYDKLSYDISPNGQKTPADLVIWLQVNRIKMLNIAGNSERTSPGIYKFAFGFLATAFMNLAAERDNHSFPPVA